MKSNLYRILTNMTIWTAKRIKFEARETGQIDAANWSESFWLKILYILDHWIVCQNNIAKTVTTNIWLLAETRCSSVQYCFCRNQGAPLLLDLGLLLILLYSAIPYHTIRTKDYCSQITTTHFQVSGKLNKQTNRATAYALLIPDRAVGLTWAKGKLPQLTHPDLWQISWT